MTLAELFAFGMIMSVPVGGCIYAIITKRRVQMKLR